MSYAPLDPTKTLVLFADLQAGILERTGTQPVASLTRAVGALAQLAALFDMPAVVTTAPVEGGVAVTPEIEAALGVLAPHTRTCTDAFLDKATAEALTGAGRPTLLIAGVATEIIVQHSALSGLSRGFEVQVVIDACGGISPRTEDAALRRMAAAGVVTTSIASLAGQLAGDFSQGKGGQALGVLYAMAGG
jgi:nicotinamidase-related amidase